MLKKISVAEEKKFEIKNVLKRKERYLNTNPMERYATDEFYRKKVDYIEKELYGIDGVILDIGGNTAGEATILQQKGFKFIVGDINEYALDISQERVNKFQLISPRYIAFDAHVIPFADNTFDAITIIEALHHLVDYDSVLIEVLRVLRPGGKFISLEPYALNPIRRLSEIRDYCRGTIEKSFTKKFLRLILYKNGFYNVKVHTVSMGKSSWKMYEVPLYRKPIAYLHSFLSRNFPMIFGSLLISAKKLDKNSERKNEKEQNTEMICPLTKTKLTLDSEKKLLVNVDKSFGYKIYNGIPVIIADEAVKLR